MAEIIDGKIFKSGGMWIRTRDISHWWVVEGEKSGDEPELRIYSTGVRDYNCITINKGSKAQKVFELYKIAGQLERAVLGIPEDEGEDNEDS